MEVKNLINRLGHKLAPKPGSRMVFLGFSVVAIFVTLAVPFSESQNPSSIKIELYPEGQHTNPVVLYANGLRYQDKPVVPVPLTDVHGTPEELKFLSYVISANIDGSVDDVLKMWDPKDREAIRKLASDPSLFEGNRKFYRSITASRLVARISYGTYEILFVEHTKGATTFVKDYPAVHVDGSLALTNSLQGDPMFVYLSTKYTQMLQRPAN